MKKWKARFRRERVERRRVEADYHEVCLEYRSLERTHDELLTAVLEFQQVLQDLLGAVKK